MNSFVKKYAGITLASTVVIGGVASAAITPIPVISNTFAVAGQKILSTDINKLAEALNILDARDVQTEEKFNLLSGDVPSDQNPIEFQGKTYGTITLGTQVWLDRNIGAERICQNSTDSLCFGDYVQWGRPLDSAKHVMSRTTGTKSTTINPTTWPEAYHFVLGSEWVNSGVDDDGSLRAAFLAKTDGLGVCPAGFRIPNSADITTANILNAGDAFNKLKLPKGGTRSDSGGTLNFNTSGGFWLSEASSGTSLSKSFEFSTSSSSLNTSGTWRGFGLNLRCIKN